MFCRSGMGHKHQPAGTIPKTSDLSSIRLRWPEVNITKTRLPVARSTSRPITWEVSQFFWLWSVWRVVWLLFNVFQPRAKVRHEVWSIFSSMTFTSLCGQGCANFWLERWRTMIHVLNMEALVMEERLCVAAARMGEHTAEEMKKGTSGRKWIVFLKQLKELMHFSYNEDQLRTYGRTAIFAGAFWWDD